MNDTYDVDDDNGAVVANDDADDDAVVADGAADDNAIDEKVQEYEAVEARIKGLTKKHYDDQILNA